MTEVFKNKDLIQSKEDFEKAVTNDFIGDDFIEQLEWAMLITQHKFKQIKIAEYLPEISINTFDKAFLINDGLQEKIKFLSPLGQFQATPEIFPLINVKCMTIDNTISLIKIKELDTKLKRNLKVRRQFAFEYSGAFYKKDTESFYGRKDGFEVNKSFFDMGKKSKIELADLPNPISLHPNYEMPINATKYLSVEEITDTVKKISMAYQVAFSMFYEWCIYIKEYDNIGFTVPIEPSMLSEIYKTSLLKFDSKKRMLHFVKEHYRRKIANKDEDYSVFVNKYLRGEFKFDYRGFYAEIVPPRYELNRVKTSKKFINTIN